MPGSAGQVALTRRDRRVELVRCVWGGRGGRKGSAKDRKRGRRVGHFCFTLFIYLKNFRNAKFTKIHRSRIA